MCLSLTDGRDHSISGPVAISQEGRTAVMNNVQAPGKAGHIPREQTRGSGGKMGKV